MKYRKFATVFFFLSGMPFSFHLARVSHMMSAPVFHSPLAWISRQSSSTQDMQLLFCIFLVSTLESSLNSWRYFRPQYRVIQKWADLRIGQRHATMDGTVICYEIKTKEQGAVKYARMDLKRQLYNL